MGLLRFILAVCVVASHTGPFLGIKWMEGSNAVVAFFIISGFYMSLILNEKYTGEKSSYGLFIGNRLLRLMPIYYTILIAHLILCGISFICNDDALSLQGYIDHGSELHFNGWVLMIFCNLFILGQDTLYYLHLSNDNGLIWSVKDGLPTTWLILIMPAWTLSIELFFYLIAPFILRVQKRIIITFILVLSLMVYCRIMGADLGDITKSQFVSYLIYFLAGGIAWLLYKKIKQADISKSICKIIFIIYLCCLFAFPYLFPANEMQIQLFYVITFLTVPFIFFLTKNWKWDAIIGEYSYPVYITHIMVNDILKFFGIDKAGHAALNLLITVAISYLLIRLIAEPVERFRQMRLQKQN